MSQHRKLQGPDLHAPSNEQVENNTGSLLAKLSCVTFSAMGTLFPAATLAVGGVDPVRGIVQADISNGGIGFVTCIGFLVGVNTNIWNPGTKLYCSATGTLTTIATGLPVATVLRKSLTAGVLYVDNTGITQNDLLGVTFPADAELEFMWALAYPKPHKEFTYNVTGDIINFDVYDTPAKVVHIFSKTFSYNVGGNLTTIVSTNLITGLTKTRTIAYDVNGQMISETEV